MVETQSKRNFFLLLVFLFFPILLPAQRADIIYIGGLQVEGNRKTKTALILREMDLHLGDTIHVSSVTARFEKNEKLLMNTGLFNSVTLNIKSWDQDRQAIELQVTVVESWYIYPLPIFNLADRNLNVWWREHNGSLKRVNYGLRFVYVNFTGNKDNLKLTLQGGYTRRVLLQYDRPYINRKKTLGLSGRYFFDHRREFAYATNGNKLQFYEDQEKINFRSLKAILSLHYRPRVEGFHELFFKFERNRVAEEVLDLNPRFFNGETTQRYIEVDYIFNRERRDSRFYPIKGNYLTFEAQKFGIGIFNDLNKFYTSIAYAHYLPISDHFNLETRVKGQREWTGGQHPYFGLEALGFGEDFVRGYELYVMDGTDFILSRNALRIKLFDRAFDLKRKMPVKNYRIFPVQLWFTINADIGKSYNNLFGEGNPLNNRWLFGKGIGFDLVLYEKYAFQMEYSVNHLNEGGIFFNVRSDF